MGTVKKSPDFSRIVPPRDAVTGPFDDVVGVPAGKIGGMKGAFGYGEKNRPYYMESYLK